MDNKNKPNESEHPYHLDWTPEELRVGEEMERAIRLLAGFKYDETELRSHFSVFDEDQEVHWVDELEKRLADAKSEEEKNQVCSKWLEEVEEASVKEQAE